MTDSPERPPYPDAGSEVRDEAEATRSAGVGMVLGTEDATPLQFWFGVADGAKVQLDDLVVVEVPDPAGSDDAVRFFGVVDEVRRRFEGVQFEGDTELVVEGLLPANVSYAAHVLVTRVEPEEFIPPGPGDVVRMARGDELALALYRDHMGDAALPAGVLRNGEAGHLNFDFLDGTKGAHVNISGISGIATKTSYALFLLYSVFHARKDDGRPLLRDASTARALVFNVKGEDLLFLDKPNAAYADAEDAWQRKTGRDVSRYAICGLPEGPFGSVALHAPAHERGNALVADVQQREGVAPYVWTLHAFARDRMLPFALADRDAMTNLGFLVGHLEERLHKLAAGQRGPWLAVEEGDADFDPDLDAMLARMEAAGALGGGAPRSDGGIGDGGIADDEGIGLDELDAATGPTRLRSFDDLVSYIEYKLLLKPDARGEPDGDRRWTANQNKSTREALVRRLRGAAKQLRRLVRGDLPAETLDKGRIEVLDDPAQVHVVDIHQLPPLAQMFTVGVLLRQVFEQKEGGRREKVFVVLDELNKYAPAEGDSPIKDVLLDIAERGRSLGVLLIGAQQTASEVERRVVANAAIRVAGRLDAAESERPEYRFMPSSFRGRATILAPGTMILHQPDVPSPMMLTFPFPTWATRKAEWRETVDDAQARDVLG